MHPWSRGLRASLAAAGLIGALLTLPAQAATGPVLSGRVVDQSGRPVSGAQVSLIYQTQPRDRVSKDGRCLTQPGRRPVCGSWTWATTTTADGSWRATLPAGQPVSSPGPHALWPQIAAPIGARGYATTFANVTLSGASQATGTQVLWEPDLTVTRTGGRATMHLVLPPQAQGPADVELLKGDDPVWATRTAADGSVDLDEHVLEGTTAVRARAHGGGTGWSTWTAPAPDFGVPLSRGIGCSTYLTDGPLAPLKRCPYTDGELLFPVGEIGAPRVYPANTCWGGCPTPRTLVFDLKALTNVDAVVWRDCHGCTLEVSPNGNTWLPWLDQKQDGTDYAVLTGVGPFRFLRLRGGPHTYADLAEVSVWGTALA